jgi:hypothetical protein
MIPDPVNDAAGYISPFSGGLYTPFPVSSSTNFALFAFLEFVTHRLPLQIPLFQ